MDRSDYHKEYFRENKDRLNEYRRNWRAQNKEKVRGSTSRYRRKYTDKTKAHWAVSNALRRGDLIKMPCEVCGDSEVDGHHEDYTKQLEVNWLCRIHHHERHQTKEDK